MKQAYLILVTLLLSSCAHAQSSRILGGINHQNVTLDQALESVSPGSIVVIGENHGLPVHQSQQLAIMQGLRARGLKISVGMEFFTYTDQQLLNQYRAGLLSEADFLTQIKWGSPSFDYYRGQALFPQASEGAMTWALNAPRGLTGKVSKTGLASLSDEEKALLPPNFTLGRDSYKERFMRLMPHLPSPEAGERYFAAQSIWDDTMAWRATDFIASHDDHVLVIVVGEFHVQYGGGLPYRIRARAPKVPVLTFSQVNTLDLSDADVATEIEVSPTEGPRADYLWLAPAESPGN